MIYNICCALLGRMSWRKMGQRTLFARAFKKCTTKKNVDRVAVFDVDKDEVDYVDVNAPGSSHRRSKSSKEQQKESAAEDLINIDDDDGDIDLNDANIAHDGASRDFHQPSTSNCSYVDIEDDECQMFFDKGKQPMDLGNGKHSRASSSRIYPSVRRFSVNNSTPRNSFQHGTCKSDIHINDRSKEKFSESDNSDCEIIDDTSGIESWERAAKKKRKLDPLTDSDSYSSASESIDESSIPFCEKTSENHTVEPSSCQKHSVDMSNLKYAENVHCRSDSFKKTAPFDQMGSSSACPDDIASQGSNAIPIFSDKDDANYQSHTMQQKDDIYETHFQEEVPYNESLHKPRDMNLAKEDKNIKSPLHTGSGVVKDDLLDIQKGSSTSKSEVFQQFDAPITDSLYKESTVPTVNGEDTSLLETMADRVLGVSRSVDPQLDNALIDTVSEDDHNLIGEREKHKESEEFKRAAEAEWKSRQEQLRIQAEEAHRLRKRKKAETLRLLEMEKRQKQRLEEIRESQKKVEETGNLKEMIRADVRKELTRLELLYNDMPSLLRALGVSVGGGHSPSPQEVHAAYKRAALRFHPDRASRADIRQQVEAEEKFKLISRLKEKLLPLAW